tara:strand:- start:24253 stop:25821 length:1569 start_codon:yes stop_codon:yes gene_type:complete
MKKIYADLFYIRKKGISEFLKSELWPISEERFNKFCNTSSEFYYKKILNENKITFSIGLIDSYFIYFLNQYISYNYVSNYCKKNKINFFYSNESKFFRNPNWQKIEFYFRDYYKISFKDKLNFFFRNLIKTLLLSKFNFLNKKYIIDFGSLSYEKKFFYKKNKKKIIFKNYKTFINKYSKRKVNYKSLIKCNNDLFYIKIIKPYLDEIKNIDPDLVQYLDFENLSKIWQKRNKWLISLYLNLINTDLPKVEYYFSNIARIDHKFLIILLQDKNHKVYCFNHGNEICHLERNYSYNYMLSFTKNYLVENKIIKRNFEELSQKRFLEKKTNTKFISIGSDTFNKYRNINISRKTNVQNKKNKIILVGYPMTVLRDIGEPALFFNYQIKIEYNLISILKNLKNYNFIYKVHPDRIKEISNVYPLNEKQISFEKFENIISPGDIIFHTHTTSTTFFFSLNIKCPIILVESFNYKWNKAVKKQILKRIEILKPKNSSDFVFDRHNIIDSIKNAKTKIDLNLMNDITG